jgi:hypothetical protein
LKDCANFGSADAFERVFGFPIRQLTVARKTSVRVVPAPMVAMVPDTFGAV